MEELHLELEDEDVDFEQSSSTNVVTRKSIDKNHTLADADEIDEEDDSFDEENKRTRGKNRDYDKELTFDDYESAKIHVETNMLDYHYRCTKSTYEGDKKFYTCNGCDKCPKSMYLLLVRIYIYFYLILCS